MDSRTKYHKLVDSLASKTIAPDIGGGRVDPTRKILVNEDEQRKVWAAINELFQNAEEAWIYLLEHVDDSRYSVTVVNSSFGSVYNWSVGDVCYQILLRSCSEAVYMDAPAGLDAYRVFRIPHIEEEGEIGKWLRERRDKKLFEIQIEVCEWAIIRLDDNNGFPTTPIEVRKSWQAAIARTKAALLLTRMPIRSKGLHREYCTIEDYYTNYIGDW